MQASNAQIIHIHACTQVHPNNTHIAISEPVVRNSGDRQTVIQTQKHVLLLLLPPLLLLLLLRLLLLLLLLNVKHTALYIIINCIQMQYNYTPVNIHEIIIFRNRHTDIETDTQT